MTGVQTCALPISVKSPIIGTLSEKGLHADLKDFLVRPGDKIECPVDGYVADILRDDQLIEIQTRNFGAMRKKLTHLLGYYPVHLVHPIAVERIIIWQDAEGNENKRKKSPRKGRPIDFFKELVYIRDLVMHPNLTFEILMTREEVIKRQDPKRKRWKGWYVYDRRLVEVIDRIVLGSYSDFRNLLPGDLNPPFTNKELAQKLGCTPRHAGTITYTLKRMGVIREVGKRGNAILYAQNSPTMFPSSSMSIFSAAGCLGRPGIRIISPAMGITNPAPAESLTSRI